MGNTDVTLAVRENQRKKAGRPRRSRPADKFTVALPPDLGEWAKEQPEGLSGLLGIGVFSFGFVPSINNFTLPVFTGEVKLFSAPMQLHAAERYSIACAHQPARGRIRHAEQLGGIRGVESSPPKTLRLFLLSFPLYHHLAEGESFPRSDCLSPSPDHQLPYLF